MISAFNYFTRISLATTATAIAACGSSSSNQQVREAYQAKQAELQEQAVERQKLSEKYYHKEAEISQKQAEDRVELTADQKEELAKREEALAKAKAKFNEDRSNVALRAEERIADLDRRAQSINAKSSSLKASKRDLFQKSWSEYAQKKELAQSKVRIVENSNTTQWPVVQTDLDTSIDNLDLSVATLEKTMKR